MNILEQVLLKKGERGEISCPVSECADCKYDYPGGCLLVELPRIRKVVEYITDDYKEKNFNVMVSRLNQLAAALKEVEG